MDRGFERRPWRRPIPVGGVFIVLGGLVWLGMTSHLEDSRDAAVAAQLAQQSQQESAFSHAAFQPYAALSLAAAAEAPPLDALVRAKAAEGTVAPSRSTVAASSPVTAMPGEKIYQAAGCATCHGVGGSGTSKGPDLTQLSRAMTPAALTNVLQHPTDRMHAGGMPPVQATGTDLKALVAYLQSLATPTTVPTPATTAATGAPSSSAVPMASHQVDQPASPQAMNDDEAKGKVIFDAHGCAKCHGIGGVLGTAAAPGLTGAIRTAPALLTTMLRHPTARMQQGGMPAVSVSDAELRALVAYVSYISVSKRDP